MNLSFFHGLAGRLYLVAGALSLALVGMALFTFVQLTSVNAMIRQTESVRVPQLQRVSATELNITRVSLLLRHAMLSRTPEEEATAVADIGAKRQLVDQLMGDYERALLTPEGRQRFAKVTPMLAKFWDVGLVNLKMIQDGQKAEAFAFLVDKTIPVRNELLAALADTVKFQETNLRSELTEAVSKSDATLSALVTLVLASIAGLGVFSWHVASVLRRRVSVSREVAERVRDGDLTQPVRDEGRDEFSPLLAALDTMQASLRDVVSNVRSNSESVATASAQIAQGNQDLSQRTEEQASALQQTAATMDELGATVRNNADNAQQANKLAIGASDVAKKGGEVVGRVIDTMRDINDSSRKIADIIGTIDGIAFQTNILALNAAVEAARAGEQGRGFAVVAGEVRSLAQRSAGAAREIKALITGSVEQVEEGSALVTKAGSTMEEIVASIGKLADIVAEISSASAEQSSGVGQVGQAVSQMDQVTQQNAALVEESAAAAESLKGQAEQLVQAVAVFKLTGSVASTIAAAKPQHGGRKTATRSLQPKTGVARQQVAVKRPRDTNSASPQAPAARAASEAGGGGSATDEWAEF